MNISIIIPSYNRAKLLPVTIESFINQDYPKNSLEIIIADNNSTDNTREIVEKFQNESTVRIIYLFEKRQGVHYARNSAARIARHELLYFTDDDMIADQNLLTEITKPFLLNEKVGVATGKVLPKWEISPPAWIVKHCNNYLLSLLDPDYDFLIADSIKYLYSCHQAVKRDVFFKAEGFNPEYSKGRYLGDGESGLNRKIKNLGYKFGYNGKSVIFHMIPPSRLTQKYLNRRLENNGRAHAYTFIREYPTVFYLVLRMGHVILYLMPLNLFISIIKPVIRMDFSLYRLFIGQLFYYSGTLTFYFNLLLKKSYRNYALKRDWLSNDTEYDDFKF